MTVYFYIYNVLYFSANFDLDGDGIICVLWCDRKKEKKACFEF